MAAPMRDTFLPFSKPAVGDEEINEIIDSIRSGWFRKRQKRVSHWGGHPTFFRVPPLIHTTSNSQNKPKKRVIPARNFKAATHAKVDSRDRLFLITQSFKESGDPGYGGHRWLQL
jgi:hypothetical protein